MKNIYEVQSSNKFKSNLIVVLFLLFSFVAIYILSQAFGYYMGYEVGGLGYVGIALIVSGVSTFVSYYYSDKIVLGISKEEFEADESSDSRNTKGFGEKNIVHPHLG